MQGITFSRINTKTFNFVLCIMLPLVLTACLAGRTASLSKLDTNWLLSVEFLKMIVVLMCYAMPLTYFLSKIFELVSTPTSFGTKVLAFTACCVLLLPLAFVALVMLAKLSFVIPMLITLVVSYTYYRSFKPVA